MKVFLLFFSLFLAPSMLIASDIELPPLFDAPENTIEVHNPEKKVSKNAIYQKTRSPAIQAKVAALVNGQPITMADIINRMTMVSNQPLDQLNETSYYQLQKQVLSLLIHESVKLQITERVGLTVPPQEIEQAEKMIEKQNKMAKGGLRKALRRKNVPWETLEKSIKADIAWKNYVSILANASIEVRKKDLKQLADHAAHEIQMNLAEISIYKNQLGNDDEKAKSLLEEAIESMNQGMTFIDAALKYSHSASAARGGQVGWIALSQLNANEQVALRNLNPGQATGPISTKEGYKIYFLIDKKSGAEKIVDLITARQLEIKLDPKTAVSAKLRDEKQEQFHQLVKSITRCEEFDQLTEQIPDAQVHVYRSVQMSDLSQDLQNALKGLAIGKPSLPIYNKANHTIVFFLICEKSKGKPQNMKHSEMMANQISQRRFIALSQQKLQEAQRLSSIDVRI